MWLSTEDMCKSNFRPRTCMDQTGLTLQKTNTGVCVLVCVKLHPMVSGKGKHTGTSRSWPGYVRSAVKSLKPEPKAVIKLLIWKGLLGAACVISFLYLQWKKQHLNRSLKGGNSPGDPLCSWAPELCNYRIRLPLLLPFMSFTFLAIHWGIFKRGNRLGSHLVY